MTDYERQQKEEAKKATLVVSNYVNNMGHSKDAFVEAFAREHRTLQQAFTSLCLAWLAHLATLKEGQYDLRNEASVRIAKKIAATLEDHGTSLPTI